MRRIITTDNAPAAIGPYSQAVQVGKFLFLSGQIPLHAKTGEVVGNTVSEQTKQIMENIKVVLSSQGLSFDHVVKTTVFITDLSSYGEFNAVYESYFAENPPARSTVEVSKLPKDVLIEVEAIASTA